MCPIVILILSPPFLFFYLGYHKTFVRTSQKSDSCYSNVLVAYSYLHQGMNSLMKIAVCYQNVNIATFTFLASANESLVMSIPSHSGLFKHILVLLCI